MRCACITFIFLAVPAVALSGTIIVPDDYQTIQQAIDMAVNGDTVLVKQGTYVENIDFKGKSITVKSLDGPEVTTIDGNQTGSVVTIKGGEGEINGFTITNGSNFFGSGIYCYSSSPTITHNIVTKNMFLGSALSAAGAGIYYKKTSPRITCNVISHNRVDATTYSLQSGGGICCFESYAVIANNLITDNFTVDLGGGIHYSGSEIYGYYCTLENNTFAGNEAGTGRGIFVGPGSLSCVNGVLWDNKAAAGPEIALGGMGPFYTSMALRYLDVQGGKSSVFVGSSSTLDWGPGMIDQDPLFFDPVNGDYHLQQDPCQPGINNPCVHSGNTLVCNWGYGQCSTKTKQDPDEEAMDMGFHYGPLTDLSLRSDPYQILESGGGSVQLILTVNLKLIIGRFSFYRTGKVGKRRYDPLGFRAG